MHSLHKKLLNDIASAEQELSDAWPKVPNQLYGRATELCAKAFSVDVGGVGTLAARGRLLKGMCELGLWAASEPHNAVVLERALMLLDFSDQLQDGGPPEDRARLVPIAGGLLNFALACTVGKVKRPNALSAAKLAADIFASLNLHDWWARAELLRVNLSDDTLDPAVLRAIESRLDDPKAHFFDLAIVHYMQGDGEDGQVLEPAEFSLTQAFLYTEPTPA